MEKGLPDAIICANDPMAFGLIEGLKEKNIRIPEDIRIIGFDNQDISHHIKPKLTTVDNPFHAVGMLAAKKLIAKLKGEEVKSELLASRLIVRESA